MVFAPASHAQEPDFSPPVVRGVTFVGNAAIDDQLLSVSIATTESSYFQRTGFVRWIGLGERRYFDRIEFRRDVLRIATLYRQTGFFDVAVDTVVRRSDNNVWVSFVIDEGEPVRVTSLSLVGLDGVMDGRSVARALPLRVGAPFNRRLLAASVDSVRARLHRRGYPFAEVLTRYTEDRVARVAQITLEAFPDVPARIGAIDVVGAEEISPDVVRRQLAVQPGQAYDERRLFDSQLDLYRIGAYDYANVTLADSVPPDDSLATIRVRVVEADLRRVRFGAGWGTTDCFRTLGQWSINNFAGGGRQVVLSGRLSRIGVGGDLRLQERLVCQALSRDQDSLQTLNYSLSASIRQPALLTSRLSGRFSLFAERLSEFQAFRRDQVGGELSFTQQLSARTPVTLAYSLTSGRTITADPATQCRFLNTCRATDAVFFNEERRTSRITLGLVHETRNSAIDPTIGSYLTTTVSLSLGAIGSDSLSEFLKGVVEYASYYRVGLDGVFSWRVRAGAMWVPALGFASGPARYAAPEERFYLGGAASVRGFGQNALGPVVYVTEPIFEGGVRVDSTTRASPIGGNGVLLGNVEYRFPIGGSSGRLVGAVFVDAGTVFDFDSPSTDVVGDFRVTPGAGFRLATPLGPIRVDLSLNPFGPSTGTRYFLSNQTGELMEVEQAYKPPTGFLGPFRLHVSVGQAF